MKFSEIANRLTGISTPFGGASWQPAELEIAGARRVIAFLEDRRVLYDPCEMEVPDHCVRSVIEIRHCLTEELGKLEGCSELAASLRAMRAACRKFLERVGTDGREGIRYASGGGVQSWTFGSALGELRGTFGVHVAKIAAAFKLDVEDKLAAILPANADADTGDDDRLFRRLYL
jgi:hypothetical protein